MSGPARWSKRTQRRFVETFYGTLSGVRPYAVVSALLAPVAVIGGWTWAASRQPTGYSSTRDTISALAARGATDRWIMTAALTILGVCHLTTACGLIEAKLVGRTFLALGGLATLAVAALPQPSAGHVPAATTGFVLLGLWPALSGVPSRRVAHAATIVLVVLLGWLAVEIHDGTLVGLSERIVVACQALWPLAVVLAVVIGRPAPTIEPIIERTDLGR